MKSAALFLATGGAMIFYFQYEKARLERKRIVEMSKGYGKPKVGGPFKLRDLNGKEFTEKDLLGKYSMVRTLCAEAATTSLSAKFIRCSASREKGRSTGSSTTRAKITCIPCRISEPSEGRGGCGAFSGATRAS